MRPGLFLIAAASALAADRFVPATYEGQRLGGMLGERFLVNQNLRLLKVDEEGLLRGFEKRPGSHPWIGEHVGKYLHAAVNTWRMTKDERLKTQMDRMARRLIAAQLPDGYLGTYVDSQRWTSWDVWSHKYDLAGLVPYYEATGYAPALEAARKVADLLARTFGDGPGQRDIIAASTHVGMAATSVLEPLMRLYAHTKDPKHLELARYIVRAWEQPNGPKILSSLASHGNVNRTTNGKAYEMMSDLVGLIELYRVTGEKPYLDAAKTAWEDIAAKRLYPTGTVSAHEHFQPDHDLPAADGDDVGEGCATVTWLQLTWQLLRVEGDPKYARELERTVFNQLLAAQDARTGNICYFTPMIGKKRPGPGINCCVSSEPRGISMIPQVAWGTVDGDPVVWLYTAGAAKLGEIEIESETAFPESGRVKLTVKSAPAREVALRLRVPEWATRYTASAGGRKVSGKPGTLAVLRREWKAGDVVEIDMDMPVRMLDAAPTYPGEAGFARGPQVLSFERALNPEVRYLHAAAVTGTKLEAAGPNRWTVAGRTAAGPVKLTLLPFSEASDGRVWMHKAVPEGPVATVAFGRETVSARGGYTRAAFSDMKPETWASTAPAKGETEAWFAVEVDSPAAVARVVFVHGKSEAGAGWYEAPPVVSVKVGSEWKTVGVLDSYRKPSRDGERFDLALREPVTVTGIRVSGKPAGGTVSCGELLGFER